MELRKQYANVANDTNDSNILQMPYIESDKSPNMAHQASKSQ